jgi:hypothetical protein
LLPPRSVLGAGEPDKLSDIVVDVHVLRPAGGNPLSLQMEVSKCGVRAELYWQVEKGRAAVG